MTQRSLDDSPRPQAILMAGLEWFSDNPGGGGRYLTDLATGLAERGHTVVVLVPRQHPGLALAEKTHGLHIRRFPVEGAFDKLTASYRAVSALVAEFGPFDAVHSHFALFGLGPLWHPALAASRRVGQFQGPWAAESAVEGAGLLSRAAKYLVERLAYARCHRFIVLSRAFGEILARDYGVARSMIDVIPAGVDVARFVPVGDRLALRRSLGLGAGPILFAMRRLVRRMGLEVLIEAFERVRARYPEAQLLLGGTGPLASELASQAAAIGVADSVHFLGRLSDEDLVRHYQAADLTVVPTTALEGFGLVTVESLACGTAVLGTDLGGTAEVLSPFAPQLLVEPGRADLLGERLLSLLEGREEIPGSEACRQYALDCYTWSRVLERVEAVLAGGTPHG